jgi:hypothetical protein|tara:strand:- start:64 stop:663 length:600 start_codon:yes stop_codon:yes gene_type:complete
MKESRFTKGYYEVDLGLTLLFNQIYGEDEYYRFKENATLPEYKKQFSKLVKTIGKSFNDTCKNTDNLHLKEINELVENQLILIKKVKTIEKLYQSLIIFFPKICLLIIGKIPQNGIKRKRDNRGIWNLNQFRQIEYKQNKNQKFEQLLNLIKNERIKGLGTHREELKKYESTRLTNESFINWFIRKYPEIYFDLFERTE